jgi:DNA mismatch repair protein MutL
MGFRGEALASIAAVAQVDMKTRQKKNDLGLMIQIQASEITRQEPCQASPGTSIAVKNLFYNVPARRNFLKSNPVEMRHILDEFHRVALSNPDIHFIVNRDGDEIYHLPSANLRQRIVGLMGSSSNKKLIPVEEETDILRIKGYVGKPEFTKKSRGDQYFFVNDRFIRSGYLHHAVMGAYDELISRDTYPLYILFIEIDPARIDINVHPTKQEIKFEDEKLVYNYLKVAVRHALGQHHAMPTLDFDQEVSFNLPSIRDSHRRAGGEEASPSEFGHKGYSGDRAGMGPVDQQRQRRNLENWQKLYAGLGEGEIDPPPSGPDTAPLTLESSWTDDQGGSQADSTGRHQKDPYQIHRTYILNQIKSGFILIDQQAAHERILYEHYLDLLSDASGATQHQLFSKTIELSPADADILRGILAEINQLGFDIQDFGNHTVVVNGIPVELAGRQDETKLMQEMIDQFRMGLEVKLDLRENLARAMARSAAVKRGQSLSVAEMRTLIDKLFACAIPYKSPSGRNCLHTFELSELAKLFDS